MSLKLSIVLPVYNVEPYLSSCLASIMAQTYENMECIIVDDCGTDRSMEVAKGMVDAYRGCIQFKILHNPCNRGLSASRNEGLRAASGDFIWFVDSDDTILPGSVEGLMRRAEMSETCDILTFDYVIYDALKKTSTPVKSATYADLFGLIQAVETGYGRVDREWWSAQFRLYRADFLRRNALIFREGFVHEDVLFVLEMVKREILVSFAYAPVSAYCYLMNREGSIVRSSCSDDKMRSLVDLLDLSLALRRKYGRPVFYSVASEMLVNIFVGLLFAEPGRFRYADDFIAKHRWECGFALARSGGAKNVVRGFAVWLTGHMPVSAFRLYRKWRGAR